MKGLEVYLAAPLFGIAAEKRGVRSSGNSRVDVGTTSMVGGCEFCPRGEKELDAAEGGFRDESRATGWELGDARRGLALPGGDGFRRTLEEGAGTGIADSKSSITLLLR